MHRKAIKHNAKWQQASGEAGLVVWSVWFGLDGAAWGQISAKLCPRFPSTPQKLAQVFQSKIAIVYRLVLFQY